MAISASAVNNNRLCDIQPPPVSSTTWNNSKTQIHKASQTVAEETLRRAARKVYHRAGGSRAVTVYCDGSWQRRDFQSNNGVTAVLTVNPKMTYRRN